MLLKRLLLLKKKYSMEHGAPLDTLLKIKIEIRTIEHSTFFFLLKPHHKSLLQTLYNQTSFTMVPGPPCIFTGRFLGTTIHTQQFHIFSILPFCKRMLIRMRPMGQLIRKSLIRMRLTDQLIQIRINLKLMTQARIKPVTSRLLAQCSNQLS